MSHSNGARAEPVSGSQTQVVEGFKKVQTRLKTLVLTLENFTNNEKQQKNNKDSKSTNKRELFFRELNQMKSQVTTYVNDIEKQIESIRPRNTSDKNFVEKAQTYIILVQLTKDILVKLNELFIEIFDRFSAYIDELWKHMIIHDNTQARRVTREFNEFFNEKTSNSNKLFDDIQQLMDGIDDSEDNWKQE